MYFFLSSKKSVSSSTLRSLNLNPDFSSLLAQKGILEYFSEDEMNDYHPELIDKLRYQNNIFAIPFYASGKKLKVSYISMLILWLLV